MGPASPQPIRPSADPTSTEVGSPGSSPNEYTPPALRVMPSAERNPPYPLFWRSCHREQVRSASGHGRSPRSWLALRLPLSDGHALRDTRWGIWGPGYPERAFRRHRARVRVRRAGWVLGKPPVSMMVGELDGGT